LGFGHRAPPERCRGLCEVADPVNGGADVRLAGAVPPPEQAPGEQRPVAGVVRQAGRNADDAHATRASGDGRRIPQPRGGVITLRPSYFTPRKTGFSGDLWLRTGVKVDALTYGTDSTVSRECRRGASTVVPRLAPSRGDVFKPRWTLVTFPTRPPTETFAVAWRKSVIQSLLDVVHARTPVWAEQPEEFFDCAFIGLDETKYRARGPARRAWITSFAYLSPPSIGLGVEVNRIHIRIIVLFGLVVVRLLFLAGIIKH
jgi:hypothetical protein